MINDIVKDLLEANIKGVCPPQNWTTRAIDEIQSLRAKISQPQEAVGYIDEFGNFENSLKNWMQQEPNVEWKAVYTAPPNYEALLKENERLREQIAERDALIAKKDEALEFYANRNHWVCDEDLKHSTIGAGDAYEMAEKALALKVKKGE